MKPKTFTKLLACTFACLMLMSTSLFAATLTSDASDYAPGTTATLTGSGFHAGETVTLRVAHLPAEESDETDPGFQSWSVTADGDGNFVTTWYVTGGALLLATADGDESMVHAETTFTDTSIGDGVFTITGGSCFSHTSPGGGGPDNWEVVAGGTYNFTISGVTECSGPYLTVIFHASDAPGGNYCTVASGGSGTYSGSITVPSPDCNTNPVFYMCGGDPSVACNPDANGPNFYFANGSASGDNQVHLRVNTDCSLSEVNTSCEEDHNCPPTAPSCSISSAPGNIVCGLSYSLTVTTQAGNTIVWSSSNPDWTFSVTSSNATSSTITFVAGTGSSAVFTVTVTNPNCDPEFCTNCSSTCSTGTLTSHCEEHCTVTQGFYGQSTGTTCGVTAVNNLRTLLATSLTVGCTGTGKNTFTIGGGTTVQVNNEVNCLIARMPAGGTPIKLKATSGSACSANGANWLSSGKFLSVVWGQTIALGLNLRKDAALGSLVIGGTNLVTYASTSCVNGVATGGPSYFPLPSTYVGQTVNQLYAAANSAIGGCTNLTSTQWDNLNSTINAINNGFDQCRILASWNGVARLSDDVQNSSSIEGLNLYPNPTSGQLTIAFIAPAGTTSINVYNISGMLVYHSEVTEQSAGVSTQQNLNASAWADGVYFVRLSSSDNSVVGKVIVNK